MLQEAVRELPLPVNVTAAQVAIDVLPSLKLMLPVGELPPTVAVNVTTVPRLLGFKDVARLIVLFTMTTCAMAGLLDPAFPLSPA